MNGETGCTSFSSATHELAGLVGQTCYKTSSDVRGGHDPWVRGEGEARAQGVVGPTREHGVLQVDGNQVRPTPRPELAGFH